MRQLIKPGDSVYVKMYVLTDPDDTDYIRLSLPNYLEISFWEGSQPVLTIPRDKAIKKVSR